MTEQADQPAGAAVFSVTGGLGLVRDVFKARPVSVVRLVLLQAVLFASLGTAQLWLMGYLGRGFEDLGADPATLMRANAWISLSSLGMSLVLIAAWAWIEAIWLALFLSDRSPVKLTAGAFFRVLAAFVIVYGILIASTFAMSFVGMIIAIPLILLVEVESDPSFALVVLVPLLAILIPLILFMLLVVSRLTALPALAFMRGGMPFGLAWRGAKGRMGPLIAAWSLWGVVYLAAAGVFGALLVLGYGPFADVFREVINNPGDPTAQFRAYAAFSRSPGEVGGYWGVAFASNLVFAVLLLAARGIGVTLALDTQAREAAAGER